MYQYRGMKRPVLFKEGGFWFVQDPIRFVPSTYTDPHSKYWASPLKAPEVKQLQHPPRLCGSWLSAYTISRFLIARDWFRPNYKRANQLAKELCGQGPIRPIVENEEKIVGYEVRRHPRWEARVDKLGRPGFNARLGAHDNVGYVHAKYVRFETRREAQIARGLYWLEQKYQPVRRFLLELRRPVA